MGRTYAESCRYLALVRSRFQRWLRREAWIAVFGLSFFLVLAWIIGGAADAGAAVIVGALVYFPCLFVFSVVKGWRRGGDS
jgi:hypothetical protein